METVFSIQRGDSSSHIHTELLSAACSALGLRPKHVYYPCCGFDLSPTFAFPNSRVTYVDRQKLMVLLLRGAGLRAYVSTVDRYVPTPHPDVVVMFNPETGPETAASYLVIGGHFLCNDAHGTAARLFRIPSFELVGAVLGEIRGPWTFEKEGLGDFRDPIETDAEFEASDYGRFLKERILRYDGASSGLVEAHARLVARAIPATQAWSDRLHTLQPHLPNEKVTEDSVLYLEPLNDDTRIYPLPRKRSACLYAFRKRC